MTGDATQSTAFTVTAHWQFSRCPCPNDPAADRSSRWYIVVPIDSAISVDASGAVTQVYPFQQDAMLGCCGYISVKPSNGDAGGGEGGTD